MNRRDFLFKAVPAAAAGVAALSSAGRLLAQSGQRPAPAKDGEIRITDIKVYTAGRIYVRVMTDAGIDGWGEVNTGPGRMAAAVLETYKPLLIGLNPTRIEHIWQMLYRAHRNMRGGVLLCSAIAGIDIALWDILGKMTNLPVYALLGGAARDKILYYPSAKAYKATSHILHGMVETPDHLDSLVANLEETRKRMGPNAYIMYDGHGKFTAQVAIQLCKRIEHLGLLYFEEVVPPENNDDLLKVKRATSVPLAVGERLSTIWEFRRPLENQVADVLNADIVEVGGISQMHKLAAIAELYDVPLAPHSTHGPIGLSASLHVDASINNFLIQECYPSNTPFITGLDWPQDTSFPLPKGPGLGLQVNVDGLEEAAAKAGEDKGIEKAYFLGDGSVADR